MKKKIFRIIKSDIEIPYKNRFEIKEACTMHQDDWDYEVIGVFDNLEAAKEELKKYKTEISWDCYNKLYLVTEYMIQEIIHDTEDKDGDDDETGDVREVSPIVIELIKKPSYETVGIFDNLEAAEQAEHEAYEALSDEEYDEVYLSF